MKPQGKVTIFMVVMIVMLSIYYFALPNNDDKKLPQNTDPIVNKSEEFEQLRSELSERRYEMIASLQGVLASSEVPVEEKNNVIESIQKIHLLTQNETILELKLINDMNFDDVFVEASETMIQVSVYIDSLSIEEVNNIILKTKNQFGSEVEVVVTFSIIDVN